MTQAHEDLVRELAADLDEGHVEAYAQFAIRNRSPLACEVLQAAGYAAELGRVKALIGGPESHEQALTMMDRAVADSGVMSLSPDALAAWAALLVRAGRDDQLSTILDDPQVDLSDGDRWMLRTDLLNPYRVVPGAPTDDRPTGRALVEAEERWLASFNQVHVPDGLEPIRLRPPAGDDTPYQRLEAPVAEQVDGDLVTVVMSAYKPDRDLLLAVRGVMEQTWRNIELLVIDDASPSGSQWLEQAAAMDPRVRVVRAPHNRGTYEARNLAHTIAQGRWLTFQDSDDWTHPRRIELQVRHLERSRSAVANRTWAVRAFDDLTMTSVGYEAQRLNASSLLYDRAVVTRLVGGFDGTRKTGDMEFPMRLRAARPRSVADLKHPAPLAITQLRADSLSRNDATPGWMRWDRLAYRDGFMEWHRQITGGRMDPVLSPGADRPFPLPHASWQPDRPATIEPHAWEVVVMGDLRRKSPRARRTLGVARCAAGRGLRTAVAHAEPPIPLNRKRDALLGEMARDVRLDRLGLTNAHEADTCDLLVITEPASLLHLDDVHLGARRVLVVADTPDPVGWSVAAVDERCQALFGVLPLWGGPAIVHATASTVRSAVTVDRWRDEDLAVVAGSVDMRVGPAAMPRPIERFRQGSPVRSVVVAGHHLEDAPLRWPDTAADLHSAYPRTVSVRTDTEAPVTMPLELHCLGRMEVPQELLELPIAPPRWVSLAPTGMSVREFLSHLDVWVYFGTWDAAAEVAALQALDAGLPCVLGPEAAGSGLTGAVRCVPPQESAAAIEELLSSASEDSSSPAQRRAGWALALQDLAAPSGRAATRGTDLDSGVVA